ncbi:MAG: ArsR/SmtB family transcription factor [Myxococcota bacterium]
MDDRQIIRILKALAEPNRFRMVQAIAAAGELSCGEVGTHFNLSQPTISHHLKILADAGILDTRREGQHAVMSINHQVLEQALALVPSRLQPNETRGEP